MADPVTAMPAAGDITLPVAEVFGPTFQGEGPSSGRSAAFIRLGGCNLTCAGCDTAFTWDGSRFNLREQLTAMSAAEILERTPWAPLAVVTGGEPMLYHHRRAFIDLIGHLSVTRQRVEIETNGTIAPAGEGGVRLLERGNVMWNVSPKLDGPMSTDPASRRLVPDALIGFSDLAKANRAVWKLVVAGPADLEQAFGLVDRFDVPTDRVWIMPEGITPESTLETARAVADQVLAAGANLTLRQHVLLWPSVERGR